MRLALVRLAWALSLVPLGTPAAEETHTLARDQSEIVVRTDRAGLFSFAGHRHRIAAERFDATISAPRVNLPLSIVAVIDAASLTVVDDDLDTEKIAQVQETMEESVLEVDEYPEVRAELGLDSLPAGDGAFDVQLSGTISLHGTVRDVTFPATLLIAGRRLQVRGTAELAQKDYGIDPVSVGKGAVKVKNEVEVDFSFVGYAAEVPPEADPPAGEPFDEAPAPPADSLAAGR
jgi:polyisoprenoid-binding protein YceI